MGRLLSSMAGSVFAAWVISSQKYVELCGEFRVQTIRAGSLRPTSALIFLQWPRRLRGFERFRCGCVCLGFR